MLSIVPTPPILDEMLDGLNRGKAVTVEPLNVTFFNSRQLIESERYIFAKDNNFGLAKQMLGDDSGFAAAPVPKVL